MSHMSHMLESARFNYVKVADFVWGDGTKEGDGKVFTSRGVSRKGRK